MSGVRKTTRVVLRLESFGASTPALRTIARLARAMEAELAARLVKDSRLAAAMAFHDPGTPSELSAHHIERSLRRRIESIAVETNAAWTFGIAECAGVFASECALHADDFLAIALPEIEQMMAVLREEISNALARGAGVLLVPRTQPQQSRALVGVISHASGLSQVIAVSSQLAAHLREPLALVVVDDRDLVERVHREITGDRNAPIALHVVPTSQLENLAPYVRSLRPKQVVAAPRPSTIREFLQRPRMLREMSAPVLLLPAEED